MSCSFIWPSLVPIYAPLSSLSRRARLLYFGITHLEWDLRAAHSTLFGQVLLWGRPGDSLGALLASPAEYRLAIASAGNFPLAALTRQAGGVKLGRPLVKFLARILIMATPAQAKWHVEQQALPWRPALERLAHDIHEAKGEVVAGTDLAFHYTRQCPLLCAGGPRGRTHGTLDPPTPHHHNLGHPHR